MANQLHIRLVTPDRVLVDSTADAVELPARNGYMEALFGHAPLLSELGAGEQRFFVSWGFVEVLPDRVTILAETALKPEEINASEAQQELDRGQKLWSEAGDDAEKYEEANQVIEGAEAKLASASSRS